VGFVMEIWETDAHIYQLIMDAEVVGASSR
jgi:hypothetical protein